ncbi:TetR/AcrR family transcriptional regulator [Cryptosporangium sp. NPDC051539]|uniref:TetR/AcrR family transcriptional regulator n=1 Tax=Cryptosporangium sp. NPDC051539 TaxID=3363962 RepID=UPI00378D34B2
MTPPSSRRRASALSPDDRREMIVKAALPLVSERGAAVTTAQVARAAGIAEGTIFRVFPDKTALLDACVVEALRPDHVLAELGSIELDQPLEARLVEAADALSAHLGRMGAVIGALHATGRAPQRRGPAPGDPGGGIHAALIGNALASGGPDTGPALPEGGDEPGSAGRAEPVRGRQASTDATVAAVAALFEPEREQLRTTPETAASILLSLLYSSQGRRRLPNDPEVDVETVVDVFLHGALEQPS